MESFYFNFLTNNRKKSFSILIVLLSFFFTSTLFAQIIPTAGETECFVAGNGGVFADHGGTEANPVTGTDPAGFYFNCGCETVTTLCSPDGSAITLDFTAFDVFATFDFIEIYDGDSNAGTLLYGNGTGMPNVNDNLLVDMIASNGSSSFTGTTGCITVSLFATAVVNRLGWEADVTVASGATHPGDNLPCGTNLNCLAPPNVSVDNLTNSSADITWAVSDSADTYNIEYGLAGFTLGTGTLTNTTDLFLNLTSLMQNTEYQFYIQSDCGSGEMSNFAGPFSFMTLLSCPAPTNVMITDVNSTFVDISWDASFAAIGYNIEYGLVGFTLGTGTVINTTNLSTTISGLTQNTAYDFYVHSDCDNEVSNNAVVNSFNTTFNNPCDYTIELFDSFGDGWNGSILNVTVGNISTDYTFTTGNSAVFTINAGSNLPLIFTYTAGAFQNEVSYNILDPDGNIIFSDGPFPAVGIVYETFACPTCPGATNLGVDDLFGLSANVSWTDSDSAGVWQVEYGPTGFLPNTGAGITFTTNDPFASLTGLDENSTYDYYVIRFCDNGDTSALAGPFTFTTITLNDVGILEISSPLSGCGLTDAEIITITMTNYGSNPQSLIPFKFSVNGAAAAINIPLDGYFTNVIGNDSIVVLEFEATADLSLPGTYEIAAWTELDGDSEIGNDTAYYTVTNIPTISDFPYAQNFEVDNGGWAVSDDGVNQSWAFGEPTGTDIPNAASGVNAWVTNLNGNYNNAEESYVVSNCFDFSNLTGDPTISFSINFDTETSFDGGWLDASVDGGNTWYKIGGIGTGVNWYNINNTFNQLGEVWAGNSGGWIFAKHELTGVAGEADVRLRFGFGSDGSVNGFEGIGIDDIAIFIPVANDMASQTVVNTTMLECGDPNDELTLTLVNNGTATQTGFDVGYNVNGGIDVVENVGTLTLAPDETATYTFTTPFNSTGAGTYNVTAWSSLPGELNVSNDTTTFQFATYRVLPFKEDFEGGVLPNGWSSDEFNPITMFHNNISFVAFDNMYSFDPLFELVSPPIGPISDGDSLFFDYRYVDFAGNGANAATIGVGDSLKIQYSTDCGLNYTDLFLITQDNHITSNELATINIDISSLAGESVKFRFLGIWGTGDYYLDIDNINIFQCSPLDLETSMTLESSNGEADGSVSVMPNASQGPYTYFWDTGDSTATVTGITAGTYQVTVIDAFGCVDVATVDLMVNINEVDDIQNINLYPNPTMDMATLDMTFSKTVDVQVQVINVMGQILFETSIGKTMEEKVELNLANYPDGMYFVRVKVDSQTIVKKLMKNHP
ncbi:MAG: fibronectin type III domain-containing protein [Saprospiraceae bacterium]